MTIKLKISDDFTLPSDAVTQTFGVLAVRGAGKSNLGAAMAEEMYKAKLPFVVVDPVGSWTGLRSNADGKKPGLQIPIFGGRRGDVPLERAAGSLIADLVVDNRMTCVLDVSEFSEGDKIRFLIDFAERLYRRNTEPLHLFLEEADDYCPQRPMREQARLLRAWENIVRRGRARGLGMTMITQRSAALNKNVLTQIETLFVLRTTSPQDRNAIEAWVAYQGGALDMLKTLPTLAAGEAWVWSPSWLGIFKRVKIRRRWTFDSGATPKEANGKRVPITLAGIDLGAIQKEMAATIERAKADDPKALRARIAELEKQAKATKPVPATAPPPKRVEVTVLSAKHENAINALLKGMEALGAKQAALQASADVLARELRAALRPLAAPAPVRTFTRPVGEPRPTPVARPARMIPPSDGGTGDKLASGERKVLTVLAQYPTGRSKTQIALLTGYAHNGGGFNNYLSALRTRGLIAGTGDQLVITDAGAAALGTWESLPTDAALREYWMQRIGKAERLILQALCDAYPAALTKDALGELTGYAPDGGGFNNAISRLRSLELVRGRGELVASEELFE